MTLKQLEEKKKFYLIWIKGYMKNERKFRTQIQLCAIQLEEIEKAINLIKKEQGKN